MKETIVREYTEEDRELLKNIIPANPCTKCPDNISIGCCGCYKSQDYNKTIQPYKKAGIYTTALLLRERFELNKKIDEMAARVQQINEELPDFIK